MGLPGSTTPSTPTTPTTPSSDGLLLSSDPRYAGKPGTPEPVSCEFCGALRYTEGVPLPGNRIHWIIDEPQTCSCAEGIAKHNREVAEAAARKVAEEKAKADRRMQERVTKIIGNSGMGERFLQRTFDTFEADTAELRGIKASARRYAQDFDRQLPRRGQPLPGRNGFLISGTKGTGKTHIAAAIANELMRRGTAVICMSEHNLFARIRQTYSRSIGGDESAVRRIYETVPLLIIDDLGKEKATEWTLATLYAIIDGRYEQAMPLIITTNYDPASLTDRLTPAGGDRTTAETVVDRLTEMCKYIVMNGESRRSRQEKA